MRCLSATARGALHFDQEELASARLSTLLIRYLRDVRYSALVNFRLSQYFFHRSRAILAGLVETTHAERHVLRTSVWRSPIAVMRYCVCAALCGYFTRVNYTKYGVDISPYADIDRNFWGIFRNVAITTETTIGRNVYIEANVTIGSLKGVIGDNVHIHTGAVITGPIQIGDNAVIGANSLVTTSVPANTTVVGIPAKVVFRRRTQG